MKIWIDADAAPRDVKDVIYRAADRLELEVVLVANRALSTPNRTNITSIVVASGLDEADNWIIEHVDPDDVVITADIPLAAFIVEKGALGLNPRGEVYTEDNVRERLSMRDFMHSLREAGVQTGGPKAWSKRDKQNFANALDRELTRKLRARR